MRKPLMMPVLAFVLAASTFSVEASLLNNQPVDAFRDTTELQGIEVAAKKGGDNIRATAPAHTLGRETMKITGVTDISDAMRRLPGVNLRDYGGAGGMKTVSVRGLGTQHTGINYDGVELGDVQNGQIDISRFCLDNISEFTLNIGDSDNIFESARLQSAATSLNVNTFFIPGMLSTHPKYEIKIKAGSFGLINPSLRLSAGNGRNLGMSLSGDFTHALNNYPHKLTNVNSVTTERRTNSNINSGHYEWNGIWKNNSGSLLQAKGYGFNSHRHLPGPVVLYNPENNERLIENNYFGQLLFRQELGDKWKIKSLAKYNWAKTRYSDISAIYPGGYIDQRYIQHEEYGSLMANYCPLNGLSFSYAADFWHNSLRTNQISDSSPIRNSFLQSLAGKWEIWRLKLTGRVLMSSIHDHSSSTPEGKTTNRLSPSLGISIRPLAFEDWHIRFSFKKIMRMPTFNELYFDHYGSVNLNPEDATQFNFGTTYSRKISSAGLDIELSADGFLNTVSNKIVAMPYNMFVWTMTNLGKVRIAGADVTFSIKKELTQSHSILWNLNYSYQRACIITDPSMADWHKQLPYTPLNSGASSLTWQNPWVNVVAHLTASSARFPLQ